MRIAKQNIWTTKFRAKHLLLKTAVGFYYNFSKFAAGFPPGTQQNLLKTLSLSPQDHDIVIVGLKTVQND